MESGDTEALIAVEMADKQKIWRKDGKPSKRIVDVGQSPA